MMKNLYYYSLTLALLTIINGRSLQENNNNNYIRSISRGSNALLCYGYCLYSMNITSSPPQIIVSKKSFTNVMKNLPFMDGYPPLEKIYPFSSNEWNELVSLFDSDKFKSLDDHVTDSYGGVTDWSEWIQIDWTNTSKKITFNILTIPGFESFINKLNEISNQHQLITSTEVTPSDE
ncbi:unnamed protein product [Adineta ricciae]|uniref:Uncharacterized protein n=1 Tax=Adineta ricciae TaxID=249248 RepID=A0A814XIB4_ADIRI|nr:unnamed protein product [Adineta ricciae]CAF1454210.1 unnamed protein product [Adineta ricciae]